MMEAYGLGYDDPFRHAAAVERVTLEDVRAAAQDILRGPRWVTSRVLPAVES
ncbi:MAG: hypothetical protein HC923_04730 [Myxococcales bacterium]|nr:hypothetical protein [Myxococcales bacterium]